MNSCTMGTVDWSISGMVPKNADAAVHQEHHAVRQLARQFHIVRHHHRGQTRFAA